MSLKQMSSYLNLKVLVRKVEKNHSGISKLSHIFPKTLKLNTLLSPNHHLFKFLQDRERLNQLANSDQIFLQTSRKPIFQKICYESRSDTYLPGAALPCFSNIFFPFMLPRTAAGCQGALRFLQQHLCPPGRKTQGSQKNRTPTVKAADTGEGI